MNPETLKALAARIEAGETGREMDAEIMFDLFAVPVGTHNDGGPRAYLWPKDNPSWNFGMRCFGSSPERIRSNRKNCEETLIIHRDNAPVLMNCLRIPHLTTDATDAFAFKAEMLPGWRLDGLSELFPDRLWNAPLWHSETRRSVSEQSANNPAAALTAACLRALAMEPKP